MSITYSTIQNTLFPAAASTPQTLHKSSDGILLSYGLVVPIDGSSGYAIGCIFIHADGSGSNVLYINEGSTTSSDFNSVKVVPNAYGTTSGRGPSPLIWDDCPFPIQIGSYPPVIPQK